MNLLKLGISTFFIIRTILTIFLFATIKLEAVSQSQLSRAIIEFNCRSY